jgi:hypothetical protein
MVAIGAIRGGADCRGTYCCGTDRRSAIGIIPSAISSTTIRRPTIRPATIGHTTACIANSASSDTYRASPVSTGTATTVSERVIGNKGHAHKKGGRETYERITQHWCSPSLTVVDGERRGVAINKVNTMLGNGPPGLAKAQTG